MRQRDPQWLDSIVDEAFRNVAEKPRWLLSAEVQEKLSMATQKQMTDAAARNRNEPAE